MFGVLKFLKEAKDKSTVGLAVRGVSGPHDGAALLGIRSSRQFFSTKSVTSMSAKKPLPLISRRKHERCPVCGEISYSLGGVHPQCSVRQADEKRMDRIKRNKSVEKKAKPVSAAKPWQRVCPKCKALQHVRKKVCTCGHEFGGGSRPASELED